MRAGAPLVCFPEHLLVRFLHLVSGCSHVCSVLLLPRELELLLKLAKLRVQLGDVRAKPRLLGWGWGWA